MSTTDYDRVATVASVLGWQADQEWMTPFQRSFQKHAWRQACEIVDALYELDGDGIPFARIGLS